MSIKKLLKPVIEEINSTLDEINFSYVLSAILIGLFLAGIFDAKSNFDFFIYVFLTWLILGFGAFLHRRKLVSSEDAINELIIEYNEELWKDPDFRRDIEKRAAQITDEELAKFHKDILEKEKKV